VTCAIVEVKRPIFSGSTMHSARGSADLRVERARLDDRRMVLEEELVDLRRRHQTPRALTTADVAGEDAAGLEAAVQRAEQRRDKIGPVNPLAEVECAEMEERATFLMEQRRDLETSLAQLQEVIRDLDGHIERTLLRSLRPRAYTSQRWSHRFFRGPRAASN
jgi:chromosome segregation protein